MYELLSSKRFFLAFFLVLGLSLPQTGSAQCPSVAKTGSPAVILLNIYGMPYAHYFDFDQPEIGFGFTRGIQIGAIFSPKFHLVSGAEWTTVRREIDRSQYGGGIRNYRTRLLEIPLDMRMRLHHTKKDGLYFILGLGAAFSNVQESNDPFVTRNQVFFHQMFLRTGFEHGIHVKQTFNILWGVIGKAAPGAIIGDSFSYINGSYYAGLKLGLQFGL